MSVGCNNNMDKNFEIAANKLFNEYCKDWGIYDIRRANRFDERVISIACITDSDRIRLDKSIVDPYLGFHIHFTSPLWGIGGLTPENAGKFEAMLQDRRYTHYGTNENKILEEFQEKIIAEDEQKWGMWTQPQRRNWIKEYILKTRKRIPGFANCGDKFLD